MSLESSSGLPKNTISRINVQAQHAYTVCRHFQHNTHNGFVWNVLVDPPTLRGTKTLESMLRVNFTLRIFLTRS